MRWLNEFANNTQGVAGSTQILPVTLWDLFSMKDISGYEWLYAVTPDGKVWSYRNCIFLKWGVDFFWYIRVRLINKTFQVHRLVALTYIPNPDNKPCVNHIDNNASNNHFSNLEWCTHEENIFHKMETNPNFHKRLNTVLKNMNIHLKEFIESKWMLEEFCNFFLEQKRLSHNLAMKNWRAKRKHLSLK